MIVGSFIVGLLVLIAWAAFGVLGLCLLISQSKEGERNVPSDREHSGEEEDFDVA